MIEEKLKWIPDGLGGEAMKAVLEECESLALEQKRPGQDSVNHPDHYKGRGIEAIEAIRAMMDPKEFRAFLRGTILKYVWRMESKDSALENARKAQWYLGRLVFEIANEQRLAKEKQVKP
jgi:hypothetical protein